MKSIFTKLMTAAAFLVTFGGALEAQTVAMQAKVPFAWQENGQTLNAGNYQISREAGTPVITVRNVATGTNAFFMAGPASDNNPTPRLVFHYNGEQYFLAAVYLPGMTGTLIPASKAERVAMSSLTTHQSVTVLADIRHK